MLRPPPLGVRRPFAIDRRNAQLTGVRTMFSAFHHFRPDAAKVILRESNPQGCVRTPEIGIIPMRGIPGGLPYIAESPQ